LEKRNKKMMGSEKGSVLVIVITGITIIAAIGAGLAAMVSSGARTGANHSLSVQALYAAESGLEWAGAELRDSSNWVDFCETLEEETMGIGQANFTIIKSELYPDEDDPQGCEVTVIGWVGSDEDNPLAKRQIKGDVPKNFIEDPGGGGGGAGGEDIPDDAIIIGGDDEVLEEIDYGTHESIYVKEGTTINGNITISNHSDVYFYNNVTVTGGITLAPQGYAYFGDDFNIDGNIIISGEACFGNNVMIDGDLTLSSANANVCIKDNIEITGTITLNNQSQLCVGLNSDIRCDDIVKANNSQICTKDDSCDYKCNAGYFSVCTANCDGLCEEPPELTGDDMSQDPVGTEDGAWSEG
jgi:hypothetical protein